MKSINSWQGDTIPISASQPDITATEARLLVGAVGETAIYQKQSLYNNGLAVLTITDEENIESVIPAGSYKYMVEVIYSDGQVLTFPKNSVSNCLTSELPDFIISPRIEA